jgi:hypothetical protein
MIPFSARGKVLCFFFRKDLDVSLIFGRNVLWVFFFMILVIFLSHLLGDCDFSDLFLLFQIEPSYVVELLFMFPGYCCCRFKPCLWPRDLPISPVDWWIECL